MPSVRPRDIALLVLLGALWGVSFMFITLGLDHFDALWFAALRFDVAALAMVAFAAATVGGWRVMIPRTSAQTIALLVAGSLNVMAYHALVFWGQQFTTSAVSAVIVGLNPIANTVISRMALPGERVGVGGVLGLIVGLTGLGVLVGLKPGDLLDARGVGELAIALAIVCWAAGAVTSRRLAHGMPVIPFTAANMVVGAVLLHLVSLAVEGPRPANSWTPASVTSLLYLALVGSAFGFLVYFTLLERIGPIRTSLVSYIAPGFAALAGWAITHEALEPRAAIAYVLILCGFVLVMRSRPAAAPATPPSGAAVAAAPSRPGPQP